MRSDNIQLPSYGPAQGSRGDYRGGTSTDPSTREAPARVRNEAAQTHLLMNTWLSQLVSNQRDFQRWVKGELAEAQQHAVQEGGLKELRARWQELRDAFQLELKRVQELLAHTHYPSIRHITIKEGQTREVRLFVRAHRVTEKSVPVVSAPDAREDWRSRTTHLSMKADDFPKIADGETMRDGTKAA